MGPAAGAGACDDIGKAVIVGISGANPDATLKSNIVGEETADLNTVVSAKYLYAWKVASSLADEEVRQPIAADIAGADEHAAPENRTVSKKAEECVVRTSVECLDVRRLG